MIVVDTNIVAYLLMGGDRAAQVREVYLRDSIWAAPLLWRSEFRNVLALYIRQGQLTLSDALRLMQEGEVLLGDAEYQVESQRVLSLVASSRCSAYDCEFVALAQDLNVPLVTTDSEILTEFSNIAVSPAAFISQ